MVMVPKTTMTILAALLAELAFATDVSVQHDATYSIDSSRGPICSGSGVAPAGAACPLKGDVATAACIPGLPSYTGSECVAPVDAQCAIVTGTTWGCMFSSVNQSGTDEVTPCPALPSADGAEETTPCPALPVVNEAEVDTPCPTLNLPTESAAATTTGGYSGVQEVQTSYQSQTGSSTNYGSTTSTDQIEDSHDDKYTAEEDDSHDHYISGEIAGSHDAHDEAEQVDNSHSTYAGEEAGDNHDHDVFEETSDGYGTDQVEHNHAEYATGETDGSHGTYGIEETDESHDAYDMDDSHDEYFAEETGSNHDTTEEGGGSHDESASDDCDTEGGDDSHEAFYQGSHDDNAAEQVDNRENYNVEQADGSVEGNASEEDHVDQSHDDYAVVSSTSG